MPAPALGRAPRRCFQANRDLFLLSSGIHSGCSELGIVAGAFQNSKQKCFDAGGHQGVTRASDAVFTIFSDCSRNQNKTVTSSSGVAGIQHIQTGMRGFFEWLRVMGILVATYLFKHMVN